MDLLQKGLDGAMERQQTISNNLSNVNTPGYKRQDVNFKEALAREVENQKKGSRLTTTNHKHKSGVGFSSNNKFSRQSLDGFKYKNDGNSVDVDVEMANLAKNNIYYNTLVRQLDNKFSRLNSVIERGSG